MTMASVFLRAVRRVAAPALLAAAGSALAQAAPAPASYVGRPIYSEPGAGLQMPPGCQLEPSWRGRIASSELEVWVVACGSDTHTWVLRRATVEMLPGNQARLRFQVTDDRLWPGEAAGETVSVQCVGRTAGEGGFVVVGAKWKAAGAELRLTTASAVLRVDSGLQKFVNASLAQVDCARHPEREAMMRRLQQR
jgi:hypothetical protein